MAGKRSDVSQAIREAAAKLRGGVYFVKRGFINWAAHPFDRRGPRAIAVMFTEAELIGSTWAGLQDATLRLELGVAIPDAADPPEIDDGVLDELYEDAVLLLHALEQSGLAANAPAITKLDWKGATFVEFHDPDERVQGIAVEALIGY